MSKKKTYQSAIPRPEDFVNISRLTALSFASWVLNRSRWLGLCKTLARAEMSVNKSRVAKSLERIQVACRAQEISISPLELERLRIARRYFEQMLMLEPRKLGYKKPVIELHGVENLENAIIGGKGAILWVSDFSGSSLIAKMALHQAGYKVSHLSRPTHGFSRSPFGIKYLNPIRTQIEDRYIRERVSMSDDGGADALRTLRRRLKENQVVSITVGAWAKKTVAVRLLSGKITFATGAANLSRRSQAALLPVFCVQLSDGGFQVNVGENIHQRSEESELDIEHAIQKYARQLEPYLREYPDQWRTWTRFQLDQSKQKSENASDYDE